MIGRPRVDEDALRVVEPHVGVDLGVREVETEAPGLLADGRDEVGNDHDRHPADHDLHPATAEVPGGALGQPFQAIAREPVTRVLLGARRHPHVLGIGEILGEVEAPAAEPGLVLDGGLPVVGVDRALGEIEKDALGLEVVDPLRDTNATARLAAHGRAIEADAVGGEGDPVVRGADLAGGRHVAVLVVHRLDALGLEGHEDALGLGAPRCGGDERDRLERRGRDSGRRLGRGLLLAALARPGGRRDRHRHGQHGHDGKPSHRDTLRRRTWRLARRSKNSARGFT
ncbi:hypothetical protein D3C86_1384380 [compost metagenome]